MKGIPQRPCCKESDVIVLGYRDCSLWVIWCKEGVRRRRHRMALWTQITEHKVRSLKTLVLMTCFIGLGVSSGIVGPTLLDLRQQVRTSMTTISMILTARSGGHAFGSILSKCLGSFCVRPIN